MEEVSNTPSILSGISAPAQGADRSRNEGTQTGRVEEERDGEDREDENRIGNRSRRINEDPAARPPDDGVEATQEAQRPLENQNTQNAGEGEPSPPEPSANDQRAEQILESPEPSNVDENEGQEDSILVRPEGPDTDIIEPPSASARQESVRIEGIEEGLLQPAGPDEVITEGNERTAREEPAGAQSQDTGGANRADDSAAANSTNAVQEPSETNTRETNAAQADNQPAGGANEEENNDGGEQPVTPEAVQTQRGQNIDSLI